MAAPPDDEDRAAGGEAPAARVGHGGHRPASARRARDGRWRYLAVPALGLALMAVLVATAIGLSVGGGAPASRPFTHIPTVSAAGTQTRTAISSAIGIHPAGVNVRSFGAVGNGVTDDAPALRRALAAAGTVYVPAGTYLLDSYLTPRPRILDADFVFALRSGQRITAAPGAVFKMGNGVIIASTASWGGNVFLADRVHDISITGLTLDLNGAANLVPADRTITGYGLYLNAARHVLVDGVTMRNTPGQNYLVAQNGGADITVRNSTFLNGGTSIPGNRQQKDFSALYFTATGVIVDRVTIDHDKDPFNFSGGVELHGSSESVTNSTIHRSWPAVYIGPNPTVGLEVMRHTTVTHNEFLDCARGVIFNAGGTGDINGVDVSDNAFRLSSAAAFPGEPARGIDQDSPSDGRWTYHHVISALTISSNDFAVTASTSDAVIRLSQVHSATIEDNRIHDAPGGVLVLRSSPWGTTNVVFRGNEASLRPSPTAPAIALDFSGSSTVPRVDAFRAAGIRVEDNLVGLDVWAPGACGVFANWLPRSPVTDIVVRRNKFVNLANAHCGPMGGRLGS